MLWTSRCTTTSPLPMRGNIMLLSMVFCRVLQRLGKGGVLWIDEGGVIVHIYAVVRMTIFSKGIEYLRDG